MFKQIKNSSGIRIKKFIASVLITTFIMSSFFMSQIFPVQAVIGEPDPMSIHIQGNVVDQQTQDALGGVSVKLLARDPIDWYIWCDNGNCYNDCTEPLYQVGDWCYTVERETVTDSNGYYVLENVHACNLASPRDWYVDLEFSLAGYQTYVIEDIDVDCGQILTLDVELVPEGPEPVILIPGIMASWLGFSGELEIDPFFKTYENLLDALRLAGYVDNISLFQFPYEWRQSNTTTAEQLKIFIDYVKGEAKKPKVDLIGHSMGGIVSRAYIQSDYYADDVDQLIFLGTPQIGSVNAYITWERGDIGKGFDDYILEQFFTIEAKGNGFDNLFEYVRSRVISVQQLLPIFDYIRDVGETVLRIYDSINYPDNYPANEFLENLNLTENVDKLKSRADITNIVSNLGPDSTINILRVVPYTGTDGKWEHGYPEGYDDLFGDHGLEYGPGDETVPFQSATALDSVPYTLCQSVHRPMPTNCQQLVIQALTGQVPTEFINEDRFNGLNYIKHFIMMWFFSPVDFNLEDNQGNQVGQDLATGNEVNEIQGAFVGTVGNKKVIFIPNPDNGEYKINLVGTGDGDYELNVVKGNEEGTQETVVSGAINTDQEKTYLTNYDEENDEPLVIEEEQEEVTFQNVKEQVNEFYEQGLITKKCIKKSLVRTLNWLERKYNKLDKFKKPWQKRVWKGVIVLRLELLKRQVGRWHRKNWILEPVNSILINNINSLIQMIKDLD